jgi:hypothetical protein
VLLTSRDEEEQAYLKPLLVKHVALPWLHDKQHCSILTANCRPGRCKAPCHTAHGVIIGHARGRKRSLKTKSVDQVLVHGSCRAHTELQPVAHGRVAHAHMPTHWSVCSSSRMTRRWC